jgi:membrane-bound lytic murein transglycosylase A
MKKNILLTLALLITAYSFAGCKTKEPETIYDRPLPAGQMALRKITDPAEIPEFTFHPDKLSQAIDYSLEYLSKPSSQKYYPYGQITHETVVNSLKEFKNILSTSQNARNFNDLIRQKYDVYESVGCDNMGTVLFTGYYTPIFNGSLTPTGGFIYPLYKQPSDLVKGSEGEILGRRNPDGSVVPYPSRRIIEKSGQLRGNELIWLSDPFEVYIAHVQGSAKIKLPDGKLITVGYAANNGHEYHSVAQELVKDNKIAADEISLSAMIDYFKKHPDEVDGYVTRNPRFVFFREEAGSPRGSLNVPVTAMRTIATDKSIFPRGSLTYIVTNLPQIKGTSIENDPFGDFMLDQDTGGAIRAAGRCDVYMGQGKLAGNLAGKTYQEGKLYYLFLKLPN